MSEERPAAVRWLMLAGLLVTSGLLVLDVTVLTVALPTIQRDLNAPLTSVQWVLSGYALTYASLLVLGGRLGDIFGSRRTYLVGVAVFGVGSLVGSFAHSLTQLVIAKAIVGGAAAALITPATLSLMSRSFHDRQRVTAFAAWGTVSGGAAAFGPLIGGYLTEYHSWRWAPRLDVGMALVAFVACWVFAPRGERRARSRLDVLGALLAASGAFALVFALTKGRTFGYWQPLGGHPPGMVPALFAVAAVGIAGFVLLEIDKERRGASPLVAFSQLARLSFRYGVLTNFFLAFGHVGFMLWISVYLQQERGLDAFDTGVRLLPFGVMIFVGARVAGILGRQMGPVLLLRVGAVISTGGVLLLGVASQPGIPAIIFTTVVYGVGTGFMTGKLMAIALSEIELTQVGVAGGFYSTMMQVGASLGFAIVGAVVASATTRAAILVCGGTIGAAFMSSLLLPDIGASRHGMESASPSAAS
jgi:EmrB/QacA subfamily drug resistance transporter